MSNGWTEERRQKQAERCRANKPWKNSTGPKTDIGKTRASLNAFKHGMRCRKVDQLRYVLWLQKEFVAQGVLALAGLNAKNLTTNELKERMKKFSKFNEQAPHTDENLQTK